MTEQVPVVELSVFRGETGTVQIGTPPVGPGGLGLVAIPGGIVLVDPADPNALPALSIADVDLAHDAVADILGLAVANASRVVADDGGAARAPVAPTEPLAWVRRLGTLQWLDHSAPWPVDDALLRLESTVLALRCGYLLDDPGRAEDVLLADADALIATLELTQTPPAVAALVDEAAGFLATLLLADDPRWELLDRARRLPVERRIAWLDRAVDFGRVDVACTPAAALAAGDAGPTMVTQSCAADWTRVRRGLVGRDETSVTWTAETGPGDTAVVSVSVEATRERPSAVPLLTPRRVDGVELELTMHVPGWPVPVAAASLAPRIEWGTWMGVAHLAEPAARALRRALDRGEVVEADVHERTRRYVVGRDPDPVTASAFRWSARGLAAWRLAGGLNGEPLARAASVALTRAERLWRVAPGARADERAATCRALGRRVPEADPSWLTVTEIENVAVR